MSVSFTQTEFGPLCIQRVLSVEVYLNDISSSLRLIILDAITYLFPATRDNRNVSLNWSIATDLNNSGFQIERSSESAY